MLIHASCFSVSLTEQVTCYQSISSTGTCVNETGQTFSESDCCNGLGGGAYSVNNGSCVSCPQSKSLFCYKLQLLMYKIISPVRILKLVCLCTNVLPCCI